MNSKNILLSVAILATCLTASSQNVGWKQLKKKNKHTPPGTVYVTDSLLMDQTEVTNLSWREYMDAIEREYGKDSKEHIATYPDTTVWKFSGIYFRHEAYNDYPVMGITFEQAKAFCKWRTERVIAFLKDVPKRKKKKLPEKFVYRLPTIKEWELAASGGYDSIQLPFGMENIFAFGGAPFNLNYAGKEYLSDFTAPVYAYRQNNYNIFNLIGNVAEITAEKGIAKGSSYMHTLSNSKVTDNFPYSKPENWLGFRCACEVVE